MPHGRFCLVSLGDAGVREGISSEPSSQAAEQAQVGTGRGSSFITAVVAVLAATISLREDANELPSGADGRRLAFDFSCSAAFSFFKKIKIKKVLTKTLFLVLDFNKATHDFLTLFSLTSLRS